MREAERIAQVEVVAGRRGVLVSLQDRKAVEQLHFAERAVDPGRLHLRLVVDGVGRRHLPGRDDRMSRDQFGAEESDRAQVLERPRLDDRRRESLAGVAEHDQATIGHRDRPEEPGLGVRHRLHVAGRNLVAKDVRDAGVVAAAVEIAAILREDEALGRRLAEAELAQRGGVSGEQRRERPNAQKLVAADVGDRCRQQPTVGRDVELARHHAVRKLVHRLPGDVGIGHAHQRRKSGVVAHPDQRTIDGIEYDAADARLLQEDRLLSAVDVDRDQAAESQVVGREEGPAAGRIEGQRRDRVEHRALDLGQGPRAAVAHVQCGDVIDDARIAHPGVEDAARFVEIRARDRAHRGGGEVALRRDRLLANLGEIARAGTRARRRSSPARPARARCRTPARTDRRSGGGCPRHDAARRRPSRASRHRRAR